MKLCLSMLGRFVVKDNELFIDKKNIKVIERYLKYFDEIVVVARYVNKDNSLYPVEKISDFDGRVKYSLYKERSNLNKLQELLSYREKLTKSIKVCDVVLGWSDPKSNNLVKLSKKLNKPSVIYVGGCTIDTLKENKSFIKRNSRFILKKGIEKAIYNSDYVHYVTSEYLQSKYPTKGYSIGASYVEISMQDINSTRKNRLNNNLNLKNNNKDLIKLGTIGYLNDVKGHDISLRSMSLLPENIHLHILGGGNPKKYENLIKDLGLQDRVSFDGTLNSPNEVSEWLKNIDIYLQPSRTEGLPRATIEAMSNGCPVISSNAGGLTELTLSDYIFYNEDYKQIGTYILDLIKDSYKYKSSVEHSLSIARRYERKILDEVIDDFWNKIILDSSS